MCKFFSCFKGSGKKETAAETRQTVYKSIKGTITVNGVSRAMTDAELKDFEEVMDETTETMNSLSSSMDKHFNKINQLFKKL